MHRPPCAFRGTTRNSIRGFQLMEGRGKRPGAGVFGGKPIGDQFVGDAIVDGLGERLGDGTRYGLGERAADGLARVTTCSPPPHPAETRDSIMSPSARRTTELSVPAVPRSIPQMNRGPSAGGAATR